MLHLSLDTLSDQFFSQLMLMGYYTIWQNKPANISETIGGIQYSDVVPMNALHKGIEVDCSYKNL